MGFASFPFHGKRRIVRTTRDTVLIDCIAGSFRGKLYSEGNESLLKSDVLKKGSVDFNSIKGSIPKKSLRLDQRMLPKKSIKTGSNAFESARDLSSSGESDFFSITMSG